MNALNRRTANVNQSRMGSMEQSSAWRAEQSAAQSFAKEQMNYAD